MCSFARARARAGGVIPRVEVKTARIMSLEKVVSVCKDLLSPRVAAAIKTLKGITIIRRSFYSSYSAVSYTTQSFSCCNPYWISGFVDGEGSFSIKITKSPMHRLGWNVETVFKITLHKKDQNILDYIKRYDPFGVVSPRFPPSHEVDGGGGRILGCRQNI
jgi:hypothetical protein